MVHELLYNRVLFAKLWPASGYGNKKLGLEAIVLLVNLVTESREAKQRSLN